MGLWSFNGIGTTPFGMLIDDGLANYLTPINPNPG